MAVQIVLGEWWRHPEGVYLPRCPNCKSIELTPVKNSDPTASTRTLYCPNCGIELIFPSPSHLKGKPIAIPGKSISTLSKGFIQRLSNSQPTIKKCRTDELIYLNYPKYRCILCGAKLRNGRRR